MRFSAKTETATVGITADVGIPANIGIPAKTNAKQG